MSEKSQASLRPIEQLRAMVSRAPAQEKPDPVARRAAMEKSVRAMPPAADADFEPVEYADVACEWVSVNEPADDLMIVWAHGGAFSAGSSFTHRGIAAELSRHADAKVLTIDYRLAPENPFPGGLDDVEAVYQAVANSVGPDTAITLGGDSAGGALALATAINARAKGWMQPAALVLLSPWLDLTCTANSHTTLADVDPLIVTPILKEMGQDYAGNAPLDDPRVSPLFADLSGLPPTLVQVGSDEVLLDDSLQLDRKAREAGVAVSLEVWSEMIHVFQAFTALLPEANAALARAGRYVRLAACR